jgi:hypothetical protein
MNTSTDIELLEKLSIQIASENPCATREEIRDLVAEAVAERIKTQSVPEKTDG